MALLKNFKVIGIYTFLIGFFSIFVGALTQRKLKTFFYTIICMITSFVIRSIFLDLRLKNKYSSK